MKSMPFAFIGKVDDFSYELSSSHLTALTKVILKVDKANEGFIESLTSGELLGQSLVVLTKAQFDHLLHIKLDKILTEEQ